VKLILLALAALLLAVLGSRSRPKRHPFTGRLAADSRPFPLNGSRIQGRHTDGSCAFCDWLDETPVPGYRREGRL
jgi:hypothetical protein